MTAIGTAIRQLREAKGWTLQELADKMGLAMSTIAKKEHGTIRVKPPEYKLFAKAFGLSTEQFNNHWRATKIEQTVGGPGIPVINRAPAGRVINYEEYGTDSGQGFEYLDRGNVNNPNAFAVIVVGDSMEPTLVENDYVVFAPPTAHTDTIKDGQIVFVRFSDSAEASLAGGCTIARFYAHNKNARLVKENRKYPDINVPFDIDTVSRISVAVEIRTRRGL